MTDGTYGWTRDSIPHPVHTGDGEEYRLPDEVAIYHDGVYVSASDSRHQDNRQAPDGYKKL